MDNRGEFVCIKGKFGHSDLFVAKLKHSTSFLWEGRLSFTVIPSKQLHGAVGIYLTDFFHQICKRPSNRSQVGYKEDCGLRYSIYKSIDCKRA